MKRILLALLIASALSVRAEDPVPAPAPAPEAAAVETPQPAPTPAPAPKIVVLLPERVDLEWYWFYFAEMNQHIVQTKIESALMRAGFDVIDLASVKKLEAMGSIEAVTSTEGARSAAASAGAEYAVVGTATAVKASEGQAYGVNVIRSNAEITARIIRVSDGKVIAVEEASAQKGGQASRAAGQEALKMAGDQIARKLAAAAQRALGNP